MCHLCAFVLATLLEYTLYLYLQGGQPKPPSAEAVYIRPIAQIVGM